MFKKILKSNNTNQPTETYWESFNLTTVCPRSSYPFYLVTYYIKRVTTSWTYSIVNWAITPKKVWYLSLFVLIIRINQTQWLSADNWTRLRGKMDIFEELEMVKSKLLNPQVLYIMLYNICYAWKNICPCPPH